MASYSRASLLAHGWAGYEPFVLHGALYAADGNTFTDAQLAILVPTWLAQAPPAPDAPPDPEPPIDFVIADLEGVGKGDLLARGDTAFELLPPARRGMVLAAQGVDEMPAWSATGDLLIGDLDQDGTGISFFTPWGVEMGALPSFNDPAVTFPVLYWQNTGPDPGEAAKLDVGDSGNFSLVRMPTAVVTP